MKIKCGIIHDSKRISKFLNELQKFEIRSRKLAKKYVVGKVSSEGKKNV